MRIIKVIRPEPVAPPPATVTVEFTAREITYIRDTLGATSSTEEKGFASFPLYRAIDDLVDKLK